MINTPIIDVAVALFFTYFVLAVLISSLNEWLQTFLKSRASDLKKTIETLLFDDEWKNTAGKIFASPFIESLKRKKDGFPSYISAQNFSFALFETLKLSDTDFKNETAVIRKSIEENILIKGELKKVMLTLLNDAGGSIDKFKSNIARFYNDAMDRASGWYKQKIRRVLLVLALISTVVLNVDSIHISKVLWENPAAAAMIANLAEENLILTDTTGGIFFINRNDTLTSEKTSVRNIIGAKSLLEKSALPIGWFKENYPGKTFTGDPVAWLSKLLGWLITALAASMGAPFWFDIMNKFINLRGSGNKPKELKE
jgi:hypothetical protein